MKKSNRSTHVDTGWGCTSEGCYLKAIARSSQGHSRSNQQKGGESSIIELFLLQFCTLEMPMKVEIHLDPNMDVLSSIPQDVKRVIKRLEG